MTNEQAFAEFQYAVNHWFQFMDHETRVRAMQVANEALVSPIGEVQHRQQVTIKKPVEPTGEYIDPEFKKLRDSRPRRGAHLRKFAGKVWMLNRKTGERIRIDPSSDEVGTYVARGFIKAGPRSK